MKKLSMKERLAVAKQIVANEHAVCKHLREVLNDEIDIERYDEACVRLIGFENLLDAIVEGNRDDHLERLLAIGPVDDAFYDLMDEFVDGFDEEQSNDLLLLMGPDNFISEVVERAKAKCRYCSGNYASFDDRARELMNGSKRLRWAFYRGHDKERSERFEQVRI